jgi:gas vesicle protein
MNKEYGDIASGTTGTSGFAIGLLVGAVAGAAVALLFAPKPGAELRGNIGESVTSLRDAAARRLRDIANRAGTGIDDLSATVGKVKSSASSAARDIMESATEHARPDGRTRV